MQDSRLRWRDGLWLAPQSACVAANTPQMRKGLISARAAVGLSPRAFFRRTTSESWDLYWDAGPYYQRVAEALEAARAYAVFVGWQIDSRVELSLGRHEAFRDLILRTCRQKPGFHAYFLMWDYAYFYALERERLQGWVWDHVHERVHFVFDNRHPYGGAHHEKLVVIDGEIAFVGGVDICNDRWDMPGHQYADRRRSLRHDREEHGPYHDLIVEVRGEVAAELVEYVGERWRRQSPIVFPERPQAVRAAGGGPYPVLLSRTRARVGLERPLLTRETEFLVRELIRAARAQLVIENQYYWSRAINDELIRLLRARAGTGFRLFLVVPSYHGGSIAIRAMGALQTELLDELALVARQTGTRLVFGCPFVRSREGGFEKRIYVHSKVLVVDDTYLAIGSSNFNNRGFRLDTELTLTLEGRTEAVRARIRACARQIVEHWGEAAVQAFLGPQASLASPPGQAGSVYLKPYHASWDPYFQTLEGRLARCVRFQGFFDPPIPLGYVFKSRLALASARRLRRILPIAVWGGALFLLGLSLALAALGARLLGGAWALGSQAGSLGYAVALAFFLCTSWLLPVPALLTSVFAGLLLGSRPACLLVFSSLSVSACAGYWLTRVFSAAARRFYERFSPPWLAQALGRRGFSRLFCVAFHPFLSFRLKIGSQGVFSIPVRWFALSALWLVALNAAVAFGGGVFALAGGGQVFFLIYLALAAAITLKQIY